MAEFDILGKYAQAMQDIQNIDTELDALSDRVGAGKRAYVNSLVSAQTGPVDAVTSQITSQLANAEATVVIGVVTGLLRKLKSTFDAQMTAAIEEWAKENIPENSDEQKKLSDDEIKKLETNRQKYYKAVLQLRDLAVQFDQVEEDKVDEVMPKPRRRTGSRGSRGPQVWTQYVYSVNGTEVKDDVTLTDIAKENGFEGRKALTDLIQEKMGKEWKPRKDFEVTLDNGTVVAGEWPVDAKVEDDPENGDDPEDDETPDDDDGAVDPE